MGSFDFDKLINRRGTGCMKWDETPHDDVLPMWVADMDFETAPCILQALQLRVAHGVFGYTHIDDSYFEAVKHWFATRHQWTIDPTWIVPTTGVIPALSCTLKALTLPGERVLVHTPVFNCFFSSIRNSGCEIVESQLRRKGDSYVIDFDDFEGKCADEKTTVYLLCNPHNPAGRVWTREELLRIHDICQRHHVRVVADEIHCELVMPGHTYTPFAALSEAAQAQSVTLNSPSKAFNNAGLQVANIICADLELRRRIVRAVNINEVCDLNPFAPIALKAAYTEGGEWLDALNEYIYGNYIELKSFFAEYLPKIEVLRLEGTYLVWIDITSLEFTSDELADLLLREAKLQVSSGTHYGHRGGQGYLRVNIACPRSRMMEGLVRMGRVLSAYMEDDVDRGCPM